MSKNGCRYVPALLASVSIPRDGGVVTGCRVLVDVRRGTGQSSCDWS